MESVEGIVAGYDVGVFAGDGTGGDGGGGMLESAGSVVGGLLESIVGEFLDRSSDILVEGCRRLCRSFHRKTNWSRRLSKVMLEDVLWSLRMSEISWEVTSGYSLE